MNCPPPGTIGRVGEDSPNVGKVWNGNVLPLAGSLQLSPDLGLSETIHVE